MPTTAWEVVPPLGISIIPNFADPEDGRVLSADEAAGSEPDPKSDSEDAVSPRASGIEDVSRETSDGSDAQEVRARGDKESERGGSEAGGSGSASGAAEDAGSSASPPSGTEGSDEGSDDQSLLDPSGDRNELDPSGDRNEKESDEDRGRPANGPQGEIPEGMTPPATVKRILGLADAGVQSLPDTKLIAVANQKGGVGKTTSAVNVAAALALLGYRVLLVDMDPQGNASTALGVEHQPGTLSTYEVLIDGKSLLDVVQPAPGLTGLSVAPATVDLAGAEIELVSEMGREGRLRAALHGFIDEQEEKDAKLDFVIVDCPPSLGLLTINALTAVDEILIPLQCEYYALEGLGQLLGSIELVRQYLNPELNVAGIVLTMYDGRTKLAPQVAEEARSHFPELVYETIIPRSVRISEAPSYSQTVLTYDPASAGARAYVKCAQELVSR